MLEQPEHLQKELALVLLVHQRKSVVVAPLVHQRKSAVAASLVLVFLGH